MALESGGGGNAKEDVLMLEYYRFSNAGSTYYWALAICTLSASLLLEPWFVRFFVQLRYERCGALDADFVLMVAGSALELVPVEAAAEHAVHERSYSCFGCIAPSPTPLGSLLAFDVRMCVYRYARFYLDTAAGEYRPGTTAALAAGSDCNDSNSLIDMTCVSVRQLRTHLSAGQSAHERARRRERLGPNIINVVVKPWLKILRDEVFQPFFVFQIFSILLWCMEAYYLFAVVLAAMAAISATVTILETRRALARISAMARYECMVHVREHSATDQSDVCWRRVESSSLVPGDVIAIDDGVGLLPCDCALLDGGCIVNEATLTGESIPVLKVAHDIGARADADCVCLAAPTDLEVETAAVASLNVPPLRPDAQRTLFASTRVMQARPRVNGGRVVAVVTRTGFDSEKGQLIRSILHPHAAGAAQFRFIEQSYRFIAVLCGVALLGLAATIWKMLQVSAPVSLMLLRGLDLVTIVVPPTLPLAMNVGVNVALGVLAAKKIFCIQPARINMAGKVKLVCFDKTGTLTEDALQMGGILEVSRNATIIGSRMSLAEEPVTSASIISTPWLHEALACCHSLALIGASVATDAAQLTLSVDGDSRDDGGIDTVPNEQRLIGDPLDVLLFNFTRAVLIETCDSASGARVQRVQLAPDRTFSIRRRFEFCSVRRRAAVVVESPHLGARIFVKGAPESIAALCRPDTVPHEVEARVAALTARGYRVLAIATRSHVPAAALTVTDSDGDCGGGGISDCTGASLRVDVDALRATCESDLEFLGLVLLENALKPATVNALAELSGARIRCIMCTGDHVMTAVAVARDCGMIAADCGVFVGHIVRQGGDDSQVEGGVEWRLSSDAAVTLDPSTLHPRAGTRLLCERYELALTGDVLERVRSSSIFHRVLLGAQIFARVTPTQKALVVAELQGVGLYVGACGDGGNDSLMLRCAHVGVSLSESDASIAAPFTSTRADIECVPTLLKEGRSSLTTSFQLFRFMALYSVIQFFAVICLYFVGTVLGNWQYIYQDLILVFPLTVLMGMSPSADELTVKRPSGNLLSARNLLSTLAHMCVCMVFQLVVFARTYRESGFIDLRTDDQAPRTWHTTSMYLISNLQYLVTAALFALGRPYKHAHRNYKLIAWFVVSLALSLSLVLAPYVRNFFFTSEEVELPLPLRTFILGVALLNALVCFAIELVAVPFVAERVKRHAAPPAHRGSTLGAGLGSLKPYHAHRQAFEHGWADAHVDA